MHGGGGWNIVQLVNATCSGTESTIGSDRLLLLIKCYLKSFQVRFFSVLEDLKAFRHMYINPIAKSLGCPTPDIGCLK